LVALRQTDAGGDQLLIDSTGETVPIFIDRLTGKNRPVRIVLPGSSS
jgi:hypothetical protein